MRATFVAITLAIMLTFVGKAQAHSMNITAPTPGLKIVQLENRVYHDEWVIKHPVVKVQEGPIIEGWQEQVTKTISQFERYEHRKDLKVALHSLNYYRSLRGNVNAWLCIHRYEASWTDSGSPYYGGLQMDYQFMRTYGSDLLRRFGTADHWTPDDQMIVAEKARRSGRGYYPWPNTARYCGLI